MALLTVTEAAERLGVKVATVRCWIWQRRIEHVKVGGRSVRVRDSAITELIERGTVPARRDRERPSRPIGNENF